MTFHKFSKEKREKKQWIIKIRRDECPEFQVRLELSTCTVPRALAHYVRLYVDGVPIDRHMR